MSTTLIEATFVGPDPDDGDVPPEQRSRGQLVGRAQELGALADLIQLPIGADSSTGPGPDADAEPGSGSAILLSGDAGVGKTRLLAELRTLSTAAGWRVAVGHCLDFGDSALSYLPFTELFGRLASDEPAVAEQLIADEPALARLMPGRRLLDTDPHRGSGTGDRVGRADLFEAVRSALSRLALTRPLLVLIEDIHWADQSTRELLSFLFTRPPDGPVALIASYRTDDLHRRHPLRAAAAEWSRLPQVARLALEPLGDDDVRALVRELHPGALTETDLRRIVARAEGNAFFTEELVAAAGSGHRRLPTDLADLLLVRLDRLDDDSRQVVRAAAVAGRRVSHDLLAAVVERSVDDLDAAVRPAVEANVLQPARDGYTFRHALLAEAVYDDLLPGERVRWHAAYVQALSADGARATAAELARHARSAHDLPTALRASVQAGDEAMSVGGPDEAADHYDAALELIAERSLGGPGVEGDSTDDEIDIIELTASAAEATTAAGRPQRALALALEQLSALTEQLSPRQRARLLQVAAEAAMLTDVSTDVLTLTTEALHLLPDDEVSALRARLANAHARGSLERYRADEATHWIDEARRIGDLLELPDVVAEAETTRAHLVRKAGDTAASRLALQSSITQARAAGELAAELRGTYGLASLDYELGELARARATFEAAHQLARQHSRPWAPYGADARMLAAIVAYAQGDWDDVLALCDTTGEPVPGLAKAVLDAIALGVAAGRGDESGVAHSQELHAWWATDPLIAVLAGGAAIDLYGDSGDIESATTVHDEVVSEAGAWWDASTFQARIRLSALLIGQLGTAASRAAASERTGLVARGIELADAARTVAASGRERSRHGVEGMAWLARVEAELTRLRWLAAVDPPGPAELLERWRESVAAFETFGHVFEIARSRARLAAAMRASGEGAGAAEQLRLARESALRLGARPLLAELRTLGRGGPRGAGSPGGAGVTPGEPDPLTSREREVLTLVAAGRSNGEIGKALFISTKTVSVHVSNILAKLGASGRTEAAALARRRGLLDADTAPDA